MILMLMERTQIAGAISDFEMKSMTKNTYWNTTTDINCGLVERKLDLEISTDVESADVSINGKNTHYTYAEVKDGKLDNLKNSNTYKATNIEYTLYLSQSDYYFRISDYDYKIDNSLYESDTEYKENNKNKELQVYLTYNIDLINQSTTSAEVDSFEYYYDSKLDLVNIDGHLLDQEGRGTDGPYKFQVYDNDKVKNKIVFTRLDNSNAYLEGANTTKTLQIQFKVNLKNIVGNTIKNYAQILSYESKIGGYIDCDSAPGNKTLDQLKNDKLLEDDESRAPGLTIALADEPRVIEGTVFEDNNNDGKLDSGSDTKVDNVIVQLIEIVDVNNKKYEHIWQETRSGNNLVKGVTHNGSTTVVQSYRNDVASGTGQYKFTGFIPANYIIRFIYGDGTTYDMVPNVKTYNGQDYQSTNDEHYTEQFYNTAGYKANASVARDNAARRLEVMAYSTTIDEMKDTILDLYARNVEEKDLTEEQKQIMLDYYNNVIVAKEDTGGFVNLSSSTWNGFGGSKLSSYNGYLYTFLMRYVSCKTWMAAESSMINISVDRSNSTTSSNDTTGNITSTTKQNSTSVTYTYNNNNAIGELSDMNFGLKLRPQPTITLEKHITKLTITPNGNAVQPVVDANVNINSYVDDSKQLDVKGVTDGLATTKSRRDNRGFWEVQTDVEELMQGAGLEIEYTYLIKNDYNQQLANDLVNKYKEDPEGYSDYLIKYANSAKTYQKGYPGCYGTVIGHGYYSNSTVNSTNAPLRIEAGGIEEAINNDLEFDDGNTNFVKVNDKGPDNRTVFNTNGVGETEKINTVVRNSTASDVLPNNDKVINKNYTTKTITLKTTLSSSTDGEVGKNIPSYIAEIIKYSNAAGRRAKDVRLANLNYVHSDDTDMTLDNSYTYNQGATLYELQDQTQIPQGSTNVTKVNENDEFWGESIIITKPTGEDKLTPAQIAAIAVSGVAVLGVGIVLIKKFILK